MSRPSQSSWECGKGDASLFFSAVPGKPPDGAHADAARASIAGSGDRPSEGSDAVPHRCIATRSIAAHGHTTSTCRLHDDSGRTRNGGNPDGDPRPRPRQRVWTSTPRWRDTRPLGSSNPDLTGGRHSCMDTLPPGFHSPIRRDNERATARDNDADPGNSEMRLDRQDAALLKRR